MRVGEYAPGGIEAHTRLYNHSIRHDAPPPARVATDSYEQEAEVLLQLGIGKPTIARAMQLARRNGTSIEQELLAGGAVDADSYYAALARGLRLPFLPTIDSSLVNDDKALDSQLAQARCVRLTYINKGMLAIVPEARNLAALSQLFEKKPGLADSIVITTPTALRAAVWGTGSVRRLRESVTTLFEDKARFSARIVLSGKQGFLAGTGVCAFAFALATGTLSLTILHAAISLLYLAAILVRAVALVDRKSGVPSLPASERLPVYTVLIALYREADVVAQLVRALRRLNWPMSRLDIKLVCEADDHATIEALRSERLEPQFEIVEVPPAHPRTKPKALNYALAGARGEFVVIYDAEDRPHPDQLRAAYAQFAASPPDVVCLQAPLVISNGSASWISAAFALEYAALFRMLLPMLARRRMPVPLGGTSNHMRVADLRACGGWDPHNVTEDADLGMRLYRLGYRCGVIDCPTYEDAPATFRVWLNQRTRWFKGWLQTWLVMMREPARLLREMGMGGFLMFQLLIGGMLLSSLTHPWLIMLLVTTAGYLALGFPPTDTGEGALFLLDLANMAASYGLFLLLGSVVMLREEKRSVGWRWLYVPLYWMMISVASWRALFELPRKPFFWDKTPHIPVSSSEKLRRF
ncbi:cellulose synthase/poly-beta-1,6-N-acetylglucosamine synthase-like glycosyltransferase [Rhizobium sp. BK181]|uniref:glycosyltransferase family 2 protein n=1 Tax=Rhizobium sp. BK181 TaxID=2587072 RepID=UPI00161BA8D1|nr:glycosyltransferase family 2 protein [Rhizobium sp. BK181]MBB3315080.1 cellulose synthase/poly-beta-1,6-N-acetylglucosamine synthase-like glycosyltransferase [Rhizobium sp. BK181]